MPTPPSPSPKNGRLVLVRHGESSFNKLNLFTGWVDVPLTEEGIKEAQAVAEHCGQFTYDVAFTSHLERAHETLLIILAQQKKMGVFFHDSDHRYNIQQAVLEECNQEILPIYSSRALNERAYGVLQGMNKTKAIEIYGANQIMEWRRGFNVRPPEGESLAEVFTRAVHYFDIMILPRIARGESCLLVGHGNTLRAIIKHVEQITDDHIPLINLPFATPLVYSYHAPDFKRISGEYDMKRVLR